MAEEEKITAEDIEEMIENKIKEDEESNNEEKQEKQKAEEDTKEAETSKDEKIEALNDKYMRLAAEYDNFRKRTAKEKIDIYSKAVIDIVKEFLPVIDNLERAKNALESDESNESVKSGVLMVFEQINNTLESLGVEEIETDGSFDPKLHDAVMHIEDDDYEENSVAEVLQKGYMLGDKIIRCAMVKVAN